MTDIFYTWPIGPLTVMLLALMFAANEGGYRLGLWRHRDETDSSRTVSNGLKASVFGLVALLLGFCFAGTAGRHDQRRRLVLDEANAIGTCHLRAGLLDEPHRSRVRDGLRRFVTARLEHFDKGTDPAEYRRTSRAMDRLLTEVWDAIEAANRQSPEAVRGSWIVPAANEVIDRNGQRTWMSRDRLPAAVLVLLGVCVVVSSLLIGHSCGQIGQRHALLWAAFNVLFTLLLFVILDFDRPRHRGFIQVDQRPLIELKASLDGGPADE